jgi:tRNA (cmo5U34)-methyltransferase
MSKFEKSQWANSEFSQNYRDYADIYLPFRSQFIEISKSLYRYFISQNANANVLDLGCGDGLFIQELSKSFRPARVTLVDGSAEMLEAAKRRLSGENGNSYIQASFQQLIANFSISDNFDFIYSSLAIHHITLEEKKELYTYIFNHLSSGGWFINYDVVLPPSEILDKWYLSLWRDWIKKHPSKERLKLLHGIPDQYKKNPENIPDCLGLQLEALKNIGFCNVDCFFKYGNFAIFGGRK